MIDLGQIVDRDIRLIGVKRGVILMVVFRGIEPFVPADFRDNRPRKHFGAIELIDVGLGDALLLIAVVENGGAILRPAVGPWRFNCVGSWATEKKILSN